MVNYKRVLCEAVLLAAAVVGLAAGAPAPAPAGPECDRAHYDQRQNGSENYRLNIDGVVIAVAPADALLAAASDIDFSELLDLSDLEEGLKPPSADFKPPSDVKPENKPGDKPEGAKPEAPLSDVSLNEVKGQKKDVHHSKHEKAQRLKLRLANMLLPLLRKNRHH